MSKKNPNLIKYLKLFSGRVLLTVFCGISFIMFTNCTCSILIQKAPELTFENLSSILNMLLLIVSNVITFYFTRESNRKEDKDK